MTLLVSLFLGLVILIGARSNVYAGVCRDLGVGSGYYCFTNPVGALECPNGYAENYDPGTAQWCCQMITSSSCEGVISSFLPGTLVKTPDGSKKIEDIKAGDEVLSFKDETIDYSKVIKIFKYPKPYYYTLEAGEYMVKVTYNHPFYIGFNQFKIVEELKIGDTVYVLENGQLTAKEITQKTRVEEESYVYNLTVDNTNTYFANDFAVHNKGGGGCENDNTVNCPAGYKITNWVSDVFCVADRGGPDQAFCGRGPGTAQAVTGCCDNWKVCEGETDPEKAECCSNHNDQITTYACVCGATPPTNLRFGSNQITWTPGTGGTSQKIFVGANKTLVEANCVGAMS